MPALLKVIGLTVAGAAVVSLLVCGGYLLGHRFAFFANLPGDLQFRVGDTMVHLPLTTCVLMSLVLTLAAHLLLRLFRR
jgi:hypothetical protein